MTTYTGKLFDYKEFRKYSDSFIETGNAAGDGLQRAVDGGFKYIAGIEASEMYYNICVNKFKDISKTGVDMKLYLGTTRDKLPSVLEAASIIRKPVVIYLDAHVSGDTSFGYEDWLKNGEESEAAQDKTIKAELGIILSNYDKHIICIDDVNGMTDGHAEEYMNIMLMYNPEYKFTFYDECLSGNKDYYYKDKILVAVP